MMQWHGVESQWTAEDENSRRSVPDGFTLSRLRKGITDDWDKQRREFGFQ